MIFLCSSVNKYTFIVREVVFCLCVRLCECVQFMNQKEVQSLSLLQSYFFVTVRCLWSKSIEVYICHAAQITCYESTINLDFLKLCMLHEIWNFKLGAYCCILIDFLCI